MCTRHSDLRSGQHTAHVVFAATHPISPCLGAIPARPKPAAETGAVCAAAAACRAAHRSGTSSRPPHTRDALRLPETTLNYHSVLRRRRPAGRRSTCMQESAQCHAPALHIHFATLKPHCLYWLTYPGVQRPAVHQALHLPTTCLPTYLPTHAYDRPSRRDGANIDLAHHCVFSTYQLSTYFVLQP